MIEKVSSQNIDDVLSLIKAYQEFYQVANINEAKNRNNFSQFLDDNSRGVLHLIKAEGKAVGFSTLYFGFSSTRAEEVGILNDLYVLPEYRGKGYGKKLMAHAIEQVKSRDISRIQWLTAKDNEDAQQLYDSLGANKSEWYFYAKET